MLLGCLTVLFFNWSSAYWPR